MSIEVGTRAPDFTLKTKTANGIEEVKLSDNYKQEQTVLLFFPLAFTSVCTKEICMATDDYDEYMKLNAKVYGISVNSPYTLEAWAKANSIKITLLSDWDREVSSAYGVVKEIPLGKNKISKRSVFVISKEGVVKYKWIESGEDNFPDFKAVKEALRGDGD